ncbi:MAG: ABC transporter ATP-binding protein, partial [Cyanobacteria bacterium]|nr:ABC transporter ATP-binding protein [Cyanobacteriota bacterium]MDW8202097.1 ABC transporter ATP-binding protein [Cyanobacteriota bacterium SKYGB_h_bin112]
MPTDSYNWRLDMPLLHLENLRVSYPQLNDRSLTWAVDNVSLSLAAGERLGLVGESGSGKSTVGRAIMRLLPTGSRVEGDICFDGKSVLALSPTELRAYRGEVVGLVFQDPMTRLNPVMSIGEHCIEMVRAHEPHLSRHQAKQRAVSTLEAVKIPKSRWHQYPHEFSGGMRQRVAIALALLLNPRVVIADEPTTSLDVTVSAQILQELTRLCHERQMALLLISHDLAMIADYCDRIAVMTEGKLVETGTTQTVFTQPQHDYTRQLLRSALHLHNADMSSFSATVATAQSSKPHVTAESSSPKPLLRLTNLHQHFTLEINPLERLLSRQDTTIRAVDGISLDLYAGETLGLVGESGCGKSTLCRTILHLLRPTAGTVEFLGQNLTRLSRRQLQRQRRHLQMVFQDPRACLNPI